MKINEKLIDVLDCLYESSEINRIPKEYGDGRFFTEPFLGVAAGTDPIFMKFKNGIVPGHLTPAEMWQKSASLEDKAQEAPSIGKPSPDAGPWNTLEEIAANIRVLTIVSPYSETFREHCSKSKTRTPLGALANNRSHPFFSEVWEKTYQFLLAEGFRVMVPQKSRYHQVEVASYSQPYFKSSWSERHCAFAAGLGTFGVAEHLITERGCAVRCSSLLTDAPLDVTPRVNDDPYANCLYFSEAGCNSCADRCPINAISNGSHDKALCIVGHLVVSHTVLPSVLPLVKPIKRHVTLPASDYALGCGVCQYGVPCMDRNPMTSNKSGLASVSTFVSATRQDAQPVLKVD